MSLKGSEISSELELFFQRPEWSELPGGLDSMGLLRAALNAASVIMEIYNRDSSVTVALKEDASPVTEADQASQEILLNYLRGSQFAVLSEEDPSAHAAGLDALKRGNGVICVDPLDGTREFLKKNGQFAVNIGMIVGGVPVFGLVLAPSSGDWQMGRIDWGAGRGYLLSAQHCEGAGPGEWILRAAEEQIHSFPGDEMSWGLSWGAAERSIDSGRFVTYLSCSHIARESERLASAGLRADIRRLGSALKFCRLTTAEGERGDVYLRLTPTSLWDTAAGHALLLASGGHMVPLRRDASAFCYDGESLVNPGFLAWRAGFAPATVGRIIRALLD